MLAHTAPEDGDVVIRSRWHDGGFVYVLRAVPGPDQFFLPAREPAVAHAIAFAKRQGVRAWLAVENDGHALLEDARITSVR